MEEGRPIPPCPPGIIWPPAHATLPPSDAAAIIAKQVKRIRRILPSERHISGLCNIEPMVSNLRFLLLTALVFLTGVAVAQTHPGMAEVLAASKPSEWRPLDPDNTLYVELPKGGIELCNVPLTVRERP
jgi:hypothetical protein